MQNLTKLLCQSYDDIPDQAALQLLYSDKPTTTIRYRDLLHQSAGYSSALCDAGIKPGEVVILILEHGEDLVHAFFGSIISGAIPSIMPFLTEKLSPGVYRKSLASLLEITAPSAVITFPEFEEEISQACRGTRVRKILVTEKVRDSFPISEEKNFDLLIGLKSNIDDIVLLQHSSGTTGLQKGIALSHRAVINQITSYSESLELSAGDVVVSWLPLYHDMGLIAGFILPVLARIPLVLMSPFDWVRAPYRLMQAISTYNGTLCWLPNFAYNFCAQKIRDRDLEGVDLSSLRAVINCSEPMYWKSHKMFLDRFNSIGLRSENLATCYAMAENVFAVTQGGIKSPVVVDVIDKKYFHSHQTAKPVRDHHLWGDDTEGEEEKFEDDSTMKMLSAGRAIEGTSIRILDQRGEELNDRQIGEIAIKSDCMLSGYYNRPELSEKAFKEGWYLTGDLGYRVDGELFVTGRLKDLIIVGGKNIYPGDLETLASEVEGVHPGRVAAFGVFNQQLGTEEVVLVAESNLIPVSDIKSYDPQAPNPHADLLASEIRKKVTRSSDVSLRYVYIVGQDWLIKTSSGKVARSANREKYLKHIYNNNI